MILRRTKKSAKKSFLSFDKFITGIIIGGAAASIFGLSKTPKGRNAMKIAGRKSKNILQLGVKAFGTVSVRFLNIFTKNK